VCGDGLCIGYDSADAVAANTKPDPLYTGTNEFEHGTIHHVTITPDPEVMPVPERVLAGSVRRRLNKIEQRGTRRGDFPGVPVSGNTITIYAA
jgi:hypothetical protein